MSVDRTVLDVVHDATRHFDLIKLPVSSLRGDILAEALAALGIPADCPAGLVAKALHTFWVTWATSEDCPVLVEAEWSWLNQWNGGSR